MNGLIELKCKNCGSPLEADLHCAYCGAKYRKEFDKVVVIEKHDRRFDTLYAQANVPEYWMSADPEAATEITLEDLARQIADGLKGYMKLSAERDFRTNGQIIRAMVRVARPDERF